MNTLAMQLDGKILAGGSFTAYNGQAAGGIARLLADGQLDTSLTEETVLSAIVIGIDGKSVSMDLHGNTFSAANLMPGIYSILARTRKKGLLTARLAVAR